LEEEMYRNFPIAEREFFVGSDWMEPERQPGGKE
jgi:hypothetical protein